MEKPESKGLEWIDLNPDHGRWLRFCLFVGLILSFGSGCATYSDRMKAAQDQVRVGNYQAAVDDLNRFMGTPEGELPEKFDSERPNPLAIADSAGHSPLIVALAGRQYGCIRLLRKAGARLDDITPEQQAELRQLEMDQVGQQLRGSFAAEAAKGLLYLCGSVLGHSKTVPG